jgi:excisionase family DNA binding protein
MSRKNKSVVEVPPAILVSIPTAAIILGTTKWAIRRLLWSSAIPFIKIGKRFLIDPDDLRAYVARRKAEAA